MLENIANIAEIVGVTLVLVTLIFLTLQIRQNTRATRSTTIQAVMQSELAMAEIIFAHAEIWDQIITGAVPEEGINTRRAIMLFNVYMIDTETRFHQHISGFLDTQTWEGRLTSLPYLVTLPVYALWRESLGGRSHAVDFLELIDKIHSDATQE
ncbi:MAG: hypothetical protein ACR2QR_11330 [Woeseiaceae bacterium]